MNKDNLLKYLDGRAEELRKAYNEVVSLLENPDYEWRQKDEQALGFVANLLHNKMVDYRATLEEIDSIEV